MGFYEEGTKGCKQKKAGFAKRKNNDDQGDIVVSIHMNKFQYNITEHRHFS